MEKFRFQNDVGSFILNRGDLISETLVQTNDWEPHFKAIINLFVGSNDICVDIGACFGYHTVQMAKLAKRVYAYEPNTQEFCHLCHSLYENNITNVYPYRKALGENNYIANLEQVNPANIGNTSIGEGGEFCEVIKFPHDDATFIKMDAQGFEEKILDGAEEILREHRPIIFFEVEEKHLIKFGSSSKKLLMKSMGYGYDIYRINSPYPSDHVAVPKGTKVDFPVHVKKIPNSFSLTFGKYGDLLYEDAI